jgi:hypothetical protein
MFILDSGTRQLAEDLERFRMLIEAPALSLYGISYGTTVMSKILKQITVEYCVSCKDYLTYFLFFLLYYCEQAPTPLFFQILLINS